MDTIQHLLSFSTNPPITCIDMHTTGEPTRIVISGYPATSGPLLSQRTQCKSQHDHIRQRIMLEPGGHKDMYGAILRPDTEFTETGEAHMGVLFIHNEGYSTMCGHATIALGRFLVDTWDESVFPRRREVECEWEADTAVVRLHAPCGVVSITVPVVRREDGRVVSDASRNVSFVCVPAFATGRDVKVHIPLEYRWPELRDRESVSVSFCYGGAFTCLVSASELGFQGLSQPVPHSAFDRATKALKIVVNADKTFQAHMTHPEYEDLSSLYTVMVVDKTLGKKLGNSKGAETGLCFFADQQVDRSPTGSAVAARVAFAYAVDELKMGEGWTYHSLVSNHSGGKGGFVGTVVEEVEELYDEKSMLARPVKVRVEGNAHYVGSHTFVVEKEDPYAANGFLFDRL